MAVNRRIQIKPSHVGLLHDNLNVPKEKDISLRKLQAARDSADPKVRKRAVFAMNARKWNHE